MVPRSIKKANVSPLLRKLTLDNDVLKNYRPVYCLFDFAKMVHYHYYYHFLNMLLTLVDGNRSKRPLQCLSTI